MWRAINCNMLQLEAIALPRITELMELSCPEHPAHSQGKTNNIPCSTSSYPDFTNSTRYLRCIYLGAGLHGNIVAESAAQHQAQ